MGNNRISMVWTYVDCCGCAMGIAAGLWRGLDANTRSMKMAFGIPNGVANRIFIFGKRPNQCMSSVTPERIADLIDRYLATGEV